MDTFYVFQAAEFTAGLSAMFMTVAPTFASLIACNVVYGMADGFFFTCVNCLVLTVSPMKTAAVLGWEMMITSIFVASGPPLAGKTVVVIHPCHTAAILSRETKKALFYHAKPHNGNHGDEA